MQTPEELILKVLNGLSQKFKTHLVLKGGILLRLYNSPRATQDIDFVFLSQESKKKLRDKLLRTLEELEDVVIEKADLNSRGIFLDVRDVRLKQRCLIEIAVSPKTSLPPEPISTAALAQKHKLESRIVTAMSFEEAFAHKIAASLERDVTRDLYDLSQMQGMGSFDKNTLEARLSKLSLKRVKPKKITFEEAAKMLREKLERLTQKKIEEELYPLLPAEYQAGLLRVIQNTVNKTIQQIENVA